MHFNRMRTVCCCSHLLGLSVGVGVSVQGVSDQGMCLPGGVSAWGLMSARGCLPGEGVLPGGVCLGGCLFMGCLPRRVSAGGYLPGWGVRQTPSSSCEQND